MEIHDTMDIQQTNTAGALLFLLLWAFPPGLRAQAAEGVGIYTENIQGVFHIDAARNNPASGNIPAAQQADDVVVDPGGYTGIGTAAPGTQLHIHTRNRLQGVSPLRLADGAGTGKLLTSDAEGRASWQDAPPPPPSTISYSLLDLSAQTYTRGSLVKATGSVFTVPEDGFYSMDVRFWGAGAGRSNTSPAIRNIIRFQLRRLSSATGQEDTVDQYQYNEPSYYAFTTFVTLYASASKDDILSLWIYPVEGFSSYSSPYPGNPNYNHVRTKVLYKKLGVDDDTHYFD
jgi:hypothetical protein